MGTQRFLLATLSGGVTLFVLGGLIYALLLSGFFEANMSSGVMRDPPLFVWIAIGQLVLAAFLTLAIGSWAGVASAGEGFRKGALFGLLFGAALDFTMYGTSNVANMTATVADIGITTVVLGVAGAVIGAVLSRSSSDAPGETG